MNSQMILSIQKVAKSFGGNAAISDVSFQMEKGEILGLIGPNGAGKTTMFNLISGFIRPDRGKIVFKDQEITNLREHKISRLGLCRTFQLNKLFSNLSVEENLLLGCNRHETGGFRNFWFGLRSKERHKLAQQVNNVITLLEIEGWREKVAGELPYGDQKLLGIGLALTTTPSLLLLDEPFAGLNPIETERCMSVLNRISQSGLSIFIVDHNMRAIMGFCGRIIVLNFGKKVAEGPPHRIRQNPEVLRCYLG